MSPFSTVSLGEEIAASLRRSIDLEYLALSIIFKSNFLLGNDFDIPSGNTDWTQTPFRRVKHTDLQCYFIEMFMFAINIWTRVNM